MKILISGANGVVGSDLVKFFSKKNKVYGIYRTSNFVNKKLKSKNIFWKKHDLSKKIKINFKPDIIIHCAVVHSFSKRNDEKNLINSNILGIMNILDFANLKNVKKIFHLSSINVYGEINKTPVYFEDKTLDNSHYICNHGLFLPSYITLSNKDILYICKIIKLFFCN